MATYGNEGYPSIANLAAMRDKNGFVGYIVPYLSQTNAILEDAPTYECNDGTGHLTTIETGLPEGTWKRYYGGVQPSKGETTQVRDTTGNLQAYSEVDKDLVDRYGKDEGKKYRAAQDAMKVRGISKQMATAMVYSNAKTDPETFHGIMPRYSSTTVAGSGDYIIKGDGSGADNMSILIVTWGEQTAHLIYPKGTVAGLQHTDLGEQTHRKTDGSMYQVYNSHYKWEIGMSVRDYRYITRICNIDKSNLTKDAATGSDLIELILRGLNTHEDYNAPNTFIYVNRYVKTYIDLQLYYKSNMMLTMGKDQFGRPVTQVLGVPVRRLDALVDTEATVA